MVNQLPIIVYKGKKIDILQEKLSQHNKKMKEIVDVLKALELERIVKQQVDL
ncbi:MAG: hypothetical protein WC758_03560 [Candidatus Woesearchaeota archaeon]